MMKKKNQIAGHITNQLFDLGTKFHPEPCSRIEFKSGGYPNSERGSGGLNRWAFKSWLIKELKNLPDELDE